MSTACRQGRQLAAFSELDPWALPVLPKAYREFGQFRTRLPPCCQLAPGDMESLKSVIVRLTAQARGFACRVPWRILARKGHYRSTCRRRAPRLPGRPV